MIAVRRPSALDIEQYRSERIDAAPTCVPAAQPPRGFRHESFSSVVGQGVRSLDRARLGLEQWAAHRGSGVEVFPCDVEVAPGSTVALVIRQLGLWILAACRVETLVDDPSRFGFVYATLPDHPECGYESFVVRLDGDDVVFEIDAVSRPGVALARLGGPVTRLLQRNAGNAYLGAMETWVRAGPDRR
ncbi:MAG: DUF1990 family protein [Acidimicrobiales bacterium]